VQAKFDYSGFAELETVEQNLRKYNADIVSKMSRHVADSNPVLEFGAGLGTLAMEWQRQTGVKPECLEIDLRQQQIILERGFVCYSSTDAIRKKFAGIYLSNVLEHIQDDEAALQEMHGLLLEGGFLAVYVPAFMCLFSKFDQYLGHYRRYHKRELINKVVSTGFTVVECRYVDCIGFFAWYFAKLFSRKEGPALPSAGGLRLLDSLVYPVSKALDSVIMKRLLGKNLLLIARRC
jgi:SAM-dependent methyltransferase